MKPSNLPAHMTKNGLENLSKVDLEANAWSLCNMNRFNGHPDNQIPVAAHLIHAYRWSQIWQPDNTRLHYACLVHDFPESYYSDIPGFLKGPIGADFKHFLDTIDYWMMEREFGFSKEEWLALHPDIKRIDNSCLTVEAAYGFKKFDPANWIPMDLFTDTSMIEEICTLRPKQMHQYFMVTLEEVMNGQKKA